MQDPKLPRPPASSCMRTVLRLMTRKWAATAPASLLKPTRYATREQLLALPQETFTVTGDPNFAGPAEISGVALEELIQYLGAAPGSDW